MKTIIFISGLMCSGKTTLADILANIAWKRGLRVEFLKVADPIYKLQSSVYEMAGMSPVKNRGLMQAIGDAVRDHIGLDYFVKVTEAAIAKSTADLVIVDDIRFAIEMLLARRIGAVTVQIGSPYELRKHRAEALGVWSETKHRTEHELPYSSFDHTVANYCDMGELNLQALKLWAHIFPLKIEAELPSEIPPKADVLHHIVLIDKLLQKHYGICIDDTGMEDDAEQDVHDGIRPYEVVNGYTAEHDLGRIDIEGNWGLPVHTELTEIDELAVLEDDPEPLEENFDGNTEAFHEAHLIWFERQMKEAA